MEADEKRQIWTSQDSGPTYTSTPRYFGYLGDKGDTNGTQDQVSTSYSYGSTTRGVTSPSGNPSGVDRSLQISVSWRGVGVAVDVAGGKGDQVAPVKTILKDVTGVAKPGSLVAIMGASGAGKSTLLNVLTSRNTKGYIITGDIRLNGWNVGSGIRHVSAYVQQDDLFLATLTVREQLQFRALLRMDKRLLKHHRLARVEQVILEMGLTKCANTRIGAEGGEGKGISGGERKRLSFASEALTNPPIFFCDEPTSGLDSFMAQSIIQTLQKMSSRGRTILCTIHQPSSQLFSMFDQILLLAEGRTAFMGPQSEAQAFFEKLQHPCPRNYNPADHYIQTLAVVPGQEEECRKKTLDITQSFSQSDRQTQICEEIDALMEEARTRGHDVLLDEAAAGESKYESSWWCQFRYLFWRTWINTFRDRLLFRVRVGQTISVALIIGLVYLQLTLDQKSIMSINGAIFVLIAESSMTNLFAVLNSFPIEMGLFVREYGTGLYRSDTYYLTKTLAEIPLFVLISLMFTTLCYWMIGLHNTMDAYLVAVAILMLAASVAMSLGYTISAASRTVQVALAVAPPIIIPFMLFGGLFVNSDNIPVYFVWLEYMSWWKYTNEILLVNQWDRVTYIPCDIPDFPHNITNITTDSPIIPIIPISNHTLPDIPPCMYRDGADVLDYYSMDKDNYWMDIGVLFALMMGFRILSYVFVLVRARRSRG